MQTISDIARVHLHWALTHGVGPKTFGKLLIQLGDPAAALGASASTLETVRGIGREKADTVVRSRDAVNVDSEIAAAAEHGVRIICREDDEFPIGLKDIADPPIVLYVKGTLRPTDAVALAVVGSRNCTIYGSEQARRFGELLAGAGFTVVSGLARGIDAFAHHGAVDAGGRSIAVLGSGLDTIYPPENKPLSNKIIEHGCLISELPIRSAVLANNFPPRNRIIAGLSLGVLVVEAAHRSGSLITARLATEYNREVFAIPGRVQDPMSIGTNRLIGLGGAKLVTCLDDILDGLGEVGRKIRAGLDPEIPYAEKRRAERIDLEQAAHSPLDAAAESAMDDAHHIPCPESAHDASVVQRSASQRPKPVVRHSASLTPFDASPPSEPRSTAGHAERDVGPELPADSSTTRDSQTRKTAETQSNANSASRKNAASTIETSSASTHSQRLSLSPIEKAVFDVVGPDPILQNTVISILPAFPPGEILAAFTSLELKGLVRRLPGQMISRRGIA